MGVMRSPVLGPAGNTEFLLHAVVGVGGRPEAEVASLVAAAVAEPIGAGPIEDGLAEDGPAGVEG